MKEESGKVEKGNYHLRWKIFVLGDVGHSQQRLCENIELPLKRLPLLLSGNMNHSATSKEKRLN